MSSRVSVKYGAKSLSQKRAMGRGRGLPWGARSRSAASTLRSTSLRTLDPDLRKAVIAYTQRGAEVKHVGANAVNAAFNSTISAATECYPLIMQVAEGTDGHNRIGDKITPRYLIVKGKLHYDDSVAGNYIPPSTVRVMILSQKNIKVGSDVSSRADINHLLKDNVGTDVGRAFTGSEFDNLAPINTDLFTVHMDRKFKMKAQIEKQMGNSNTVLGYSNQLTQTFVWKIRCPASLTFDDGNGDWPNNFAPFICMGAVSDDNSGPYTVGTPYHMVVQTELYFTDA